MALCLRPFVSLCDFRVAATCRQRLAVRRLPPRRPLATAASAAADLQPLPPAAAPKYASLSAEQQRQVDAYLDILLDWNQRMNLTAITDRGEAYERHVNDSLALLPAIDRCLAEQAQWAAAAHRQPRQRAQGVQQAAGEDAWERGAGSTAAQRTAQQQEQQEQQQASLAAAAAAAEVAAAAAAPPRLIDVGSGAGLPGIILAIARPDWEVTLLDSLQKRCKFTEQAIEAAGLANVRVHWGRAEDAGQAPGLREAHDVAIARAVAELRVLAELCLPLVRPGGHWVAAKGAAPAEEVAAAKGALGKLGGKLVAVGEVDSESPEGRRTAVIVAKARPTPAQYPRKPGVPSKKPL
ncbi:hypothetical protein ABPG75_008544 [Micractinium tetrahymenae]